MKLIALPLLLLAFAAFVPVASAQRQVINTPGMHPQGLPFSDAVLAGDTLYLSGNIGLDPKTGKAGGPPLQIRATNDQPRPAGGPALRS